jgi:RNA 3'-terminal phosphate cyclase (ATP)
VAQVAKGGSAGSTSLIFQTVLLPLARSEGKSELDLRGGTHVAWSPPCDYLKRVYLPTLARMGIQAKVNLRKWGWYPIGGGQVEATVEGTGAYCSDLEGENEGAIGRQAAPTQNRPVGLDLRERGELVRVRGVSASSNLPKHIRVRQEGAALQLLRSNGVNARIEIVDAPSKGKGTVVFLWAEFENAIAGFTSLGERGKPAEQVAEEAVQDLLAYLESGAGLERHLADQLVLPMALAEGPSQFTTQEVTGHLLTNAWVVNQFMPGCVRVAGAEGDSGACWIDGSRAL